MPLSTTAKSKSALSFPFCPKCGDTNVKGPIDSAPKGDRFEFSRQWFCPRCWWQTEVKMHDDALYAKAMATRVPKSRPDKAGSR